jgi:hypothetical protein
MPLEENASVHDSLTATIDAMEQSSASSPDAAAAPVAPAPSQEAAAPAATPAAPQDKGSGTGRDASGRFLKKAGDAEPAAVPTGDAPAAAPAAPVVAEGAPTDGKMATPPVVPTADDAPTSWTPELKEKWAGLDPALKGEIQRREREITTGLQRAAEARKFGDSVMQEFAPYAEILSKEGATPQAAMRALLETSYTLRYGSKEHKTALFQAMANQYGIDLNAQVDPEKANLQRELDNRRLEDARRGSMQQSTISQEVASELQAFIDAPGHEHYATVRPIMAGMLGSGAATTLQEAYERACWADPSIRASMQLADSTKRVESQAKNRNALATVNGAPGAVATGSALPDAGNMRQFIAAQFEPGGGSKRV